MDSLFLFLLMIGLLLISVLIIVVIRLRIESLLMRYRQRAVSEFITFLSGAFRPNEIMPSARTEERPNEWPTIIFLSIALIVLVRLLLI